VDLSGRRVLVVGASRGIGAAIATAAAAAGARVVASARTPPAHEGVVGLAADVVDPDQCLHLVDDAVNELGGLDALVYCPAVLPLAALGHTDADTWSAVLDTNVRGAALVTAAALPALASARGRAAYLSSDIVVTPRAGLGAYGVSKAALDALVEQWQLEVTGVAFTRVRVGPTLTMIAAGWDRALAAEYFAQWQAAGTAPTAVLTADEVAVEVLGVLAAEHPPPVLDVRPRASDEGARLILLNGPPGIGKSTLARRYVSDRPMSLILDIDVVRRGIGGWEEQQEEAGLLARALALAMARVHLTAGHDVVVPQYVARPAFIDEMAATAAAARAAFHEVYLTDGKAAAIARFHARAEDAALAQHHAEAVRNAGGEDGLAAMFDRVESTRALRTGAITVKTLAGDVDQAYRDFLSAVESGQSSARR
jgi:NAD(P)-dependent dehydrogenase (short-subunit alcohol dehydrogenase family)/predicted kinase